MWNADLSLAKNFNLTERVHFQLRAEAYNAFNHTEWGTVNTAITFNSTGQIINLPSSANRFGFGALNGIRANSQRILQVAIKASF